MFSFVKIAFLRSPRRTIEFVDKCEPLLRGQFDMLNDQFTEYPVEPAYRIIMHFNAWLRCKTKSKMKKVIKIQNKERDRKGRRETHKQTDRRAGR